MASLPYVYSFQSETTPYNYGWQGPNAGPQLLPEAGAERTLEAVGWTPL
jgi:hypothetical protein